MNEGVTISERYLARLGRLSFLRLWSWPNVFRDQRAGPRTEGKEVCDLLAIFGPHVFIFSDKYCEFPATGDLKADWCRWFKRTVWDSAKQIWGAERWLREHPDRLFRDRGCTVRLPIDLPPSRDAVFHRIVVAHGASARCREALGGSGSLMIFPHVTGRQHFDPRAEVLPFAVGRLDPGRGFVHVMDDVTLDVVLDTVDTVSDLAGYFEEKERCIASGRLGSAAGEEEILATYLSNTDRAGKHSLDVFGEDASISLGEGCWEHFSRKPQRLAQIEANKDSYAWDSLINEFTKHILGGTEHFRSTNTTVADLEVALRFMASENRTERRMLARDLRYALEKGRQTDRFARILDARTGPTGERPTYVFMTLKRPADVTYEDYRRVRHEMLMAYLVVTRWKRPSAKHLVGIAMAPLGEVLSGADLVYLDGRYWTEEMAAGAERMQRELDMFTHVRRNDVRDSEYPIVKPVVLAKGRDRNQACPCGSGKKLKKCHGVAGGVHQDR